MKVDFKLSSMLKRERDRKKASMKYYMKAWLMEGRSSTLRIKFLLFLSFSAKWASKSLISCIFKSLEEMSEEMHLKKLGVRVGGLIWMTLPTISRRGMAKKS